MSNMMKPAKLFGTQEKEQLEQEVNDGIRKLPVELRGQAVALNNILIQKKKLDSELEKEIQTLTLKYEKLGEPLIHKSNDIIGGKAALSDEDMAGIDGFVAEGEKDQIKTDSAIPNYWFTALKNCDMFAQDIKEHDEAILKHITKIECKVHEEHNYTIFFYFSENEFFTNNLLTKSFVMKEAENPTKSEGTEIEWKEGKDITKKSVQKKQKNKKTGVSRTVTKNVDADSFFNFFKSISVEAEELEDLDDEEADYNQERMDVDYDTSQILMDEVIPYSLEYFLGIKMEDGCCEDENCDEDHEHGKKGGKKSSEFDDITEEEE